jgi:hypothetical protein
MTIKPKLLIFWGFTLIVFAFTLLTNLFWPISDWDALALYDFRANVFLIDTNLIHAALSNSYFVQYPLLTSLAHLFVYQTGVLNPKFIYSLFYLSFVTTFYYSLRRRVNENKAILFTFILSLVPEILTQATMAYTNLPYMVYLCSGIFYLYDWIKNRNHFTLILSAVLVGLSSWVRFAEPFWLVPLLIVFIMAVKNKKWKEFMYYLIIILTFYLPWRVFTDYVYGATIPVSNTVGLNYLAILKSINFEKILLVINYLYINVFSTWGLIFLLFIMILIRTAVNRKKSNNTFLYITLLFFAFLFAGTLFFSINYPNWQDIPESVRRVSMFLLPLTLYWIALSIDY